MDRIEIEHANRRYEALSKTLEGMAERFEARKPQILARFDAMQIGDEERNGAVCIARTSDTVILEFHGEIRVIERAKFI